MPEVDGDVLGPLFGLLAALLGLPAAFRARRWMGERLPRSESIAKFEGSSFRGGAEIYRPTALGPEALPVDAVTFAINEEQLCVKGRSPSFGLVLTLECLKLSRSKAFIGTQVRIQSADPALTDAFDHMIISHGVAKRLDRLSEGNFGYSAQIASRRQR